MKTILELLALALGALLSWLLSVSVAGAPVDMIINGLHPKISPFELEVDEDAKDVKLKDRAPFKPSKGSELGLHRRFRFQGRTDGGKAVLRYAREIVGDGTVWMRIAVDSTNGLTTPVDGEGEPQGASLFLGSPTATDRPRVEAMWNEAIDGFTVRATDDGVPVGTSFDFPGERELFLVGTRSADQLTFEVAYAVSDAYDALAGRQTVWSRSGVAAEPYSLEVGVQDLGKGGRFYATQLTIRLVPGAASSTGPTETPLAEVLVEGLLDIDVVDTMLFFPPPHDFPTIVASLTGAQEQLDAALALIDQGRQAEGGFLPETPLDTIAKWLGRSDKALKKALVKVQKLQDKGAPSAKSMKRVVNRAQTGFRISLGQLFGFKIAKLGRLNRAVDLD